MPEPAFLLGIVMVLSLTAYAVLGGADYGGGAWDLLAAGRTADKQRTLIARAIAPVWEANHVWLILVLTVLFTAFPAAFAWMGTYLHIPLALAMIGIVFRGSAFIFRAYGPSDEQSDRRWGRVFAGASTVTPVLLGLIVGAITEGLVPASGSGFRQTFIDPWVTPFAMSVGLFTLVLFAYLAAVYLTLEAGADQPLAEAFRRRALASGALTGAMALLVFLLADRAPHVRAGLTGSAWAVPLHVATAACAVGSWSSLWVRSFWWARAAAIAQVSLIIWGWALAQYPYLIRPHLTISAAAAPRPLLVLLLQVLAVGAVILIPALLYLFRIFGPARPGAPST
jgi:cytochrome d ubiquinol oxidase subunit II